jgi:hypothetical protein
MRHREMRAERVIGIDATEIRCPKVDQDHRAIEHRELVQMGRLDQACDRQRIRRVPA